MTDSAHSLGDTTSKPLASLTHAERLLLAAEDCCKSLHLVQLAYNALERFNFLDMHMAPEDMPIDRAELGALLALVNEAAMKRIDDTMAAVRHARGVKGPMPGW